MHLHLHITVRSKVAVPLRINVSHSKYICILNGFSGDATIRKHNLSEGLNEEEMNRINYTKQTSHMEPLTHEQCRIQTEEPPSNG